MKEANTNLMTVAAPDMLKALKEVARQFEDVHEVPQCVYDAIAKAEKGEI